MTEFVEGCRPALVFLRDHGPHTMGQIDDEGAFAAALVFLECEKLGLVSRINFGNGHVQYTLTDAGRVEANRRATA